MAPQNNIFWHIVPGQVEVEGVVRSQPRNKRNKSYVVLEASSLDGKDVSGKVLVSYASDIADIEPGDVLKITGQIKKPHQNTNPGGFDYARYLSRQKIYSLLYAREIIKTSHKAIPFYKSLALKIRSSMISAIKNNLPGLEGVLLSKMLVGERSRLPEDEKEKFVDAGVMHVLVVSGMHVGYCVAIFWGLFRLLGLSYRRAALFTIPFIPIYALVTGANPPVLRASMMAIFIIISLSLARESNIYQSLSIAALTILILNPQALFTASFQLSFAATLGIVYIYPFLNKAINPENNFLNEEDKLRKIVRFLQWPLRLFMVSFAAQLAVSPLIAYYFNKISLIGILTNMFVIPLVGIIIAAGLVLYIINTALPGLVFLISFIASINYYLLKMLTFIVDYFSSLPGATLQLPTPSIFFIICYYIFLICVFQIKKYPKTRYILGLLVMLSVLNTYFRSIRLKKCLDITFLDVGYGDAIHLRFPNGQNWLIDTGGSYNPLFDIGERVIYPYLSGKGIRTLDKVIITNPNYPRYGGLKEIAKDIVIKEIIYSPQVDFSQEYFDLLKLTGDKKIPFREAWAGDVFKIADAAVSVISPARLFARRDDNCLILLLDYHNHRVLFTSDMGENAERLLSDSNLNIETDMLQLPKHGLRKLSDIFIKKTGADFIVVSTSRKNPDGIEGFHDKSIYSTKEMGAIKISLSKNKIIKIERFLE
ncbi:MAG: DNA internalization-related competence protein ComEC/Rec2 [Endomicrobiales bacterium]|nr:DNA internalization-related competence protein ComEC/Rec2 [Endomicrobiales bacterium]